MQILRLVKRVNCKIFGHKWENILKYDYEKRSSNKMLRCRRCGEEI